MVYCDPAIDDELAQKDAEIERLQLIEKATRDLFIGTARFMSDGDEKQWAAYDYLGGLFSKPATEMSVSNVDQANTDGEKP